MSVVVDGHGGAGVDVVDGVGGDGDGVDPVLAAAHRGDPDALARLLKAKEPQIRRYALRHCVFVVVDDAVQDSMLIVARRLPTVRVLRAFSGWLLRVVRHECHRLGRRFAGDVFDYESAVALLARHDDAELRLMVAEGLESLPPHYRSVLVLRDIEELSIAEIAARLGEPVGAVKSRLHRARALLREYLVA